MNARRRRRRIPPTPMLPVTSMMDMFVIILVFLLNFLDPAAAPEVEIALPKSHAEAATEAGRVLTISRDQIRVDGERVMTLALRDGAPALPDGTARQGRRIDPLYEHLVDVAPPILVAPSGAGQENRASEAVLRVECDKGVPFSLLGDVLFTAGQAGYDQFRFVVISEAG